MTPSDTRGQATVVMQGMVFLIIMSIGVLILQDIHGVMTAAQTAPAGEPQTVGEPLNIVEPLLAVIGFVVTLKVAWPLARAAKRLAAPFALAGP